MAAFIDGQLLFQGKISRTNLRRDFSEDTSAERSKIEAWTMPPTLTEAIREVDYCLQI
jgi:hypothetical protein